MNLKLVHFLIHLNFYAIFSSVLSLQDFMEDLWERIQILSRSGWKVKSGMQKITFALLFQWHFFMSSAS